MFIQYEWIIMIFYKRKEVALWLVKARNPARVKAGKADVRVSNQQ